MAPSSLYMMIAVAGAACSGMAVTYVIADSLNERVRYTGIQKQAGVGSVARRLLRRGVPVLRRCSTATLRMRLVRDAVVKLCMVFKIRGFDCTEQSVASLLAAASGVLFLSGCAFGSWVAGIAFAACFFAAASSWASHVLEEHRERIREALPDAVRAMSACFHAGYTLQQTFDQLNRELPGPVGALFGSARDAMETGSTAKEALASLRGSGSVPELSFISVALDVQHRAGGSMRHVLDAACESLESELELRRSLRVHTAQARLSARVVTGVTIGLVGVLSLLTEDFLGPFFESALGLALLTTAVAMQCAGILIVRRMLKVEVD